MEKVIKIHGQDITFKTDGAFPRFYRLLHKRDIFNDMQSIVGKDALANGGIEVMENVSYAMAKYADKEMPLTIDEWLSQFETFDLIGALPDVMSLWTDEIETQSESKKKKGQ